ncbi:M20/M25/M40 family metallo-hydrolase [Streptomyces californicus]|uniref:M20/M25/M40 family metallo-hydrolase n=1 Tax=Streptomyces californicus TaxID=67351 RepID=UPI0037AA7364
MTVPTRDLGRPPVARDHAAVDTLHRFLRIPSPSGEEGPMAAEAVAVMRGLGYRAEIDAAGNAVGVIGTGDGPRLMLLSHIDTVSGQLPVHLSDGRLHGRGAVDAKAPFAAMVHAGAALGPHFPGSVTVVGAVEEETSGSRGAVAVRETHRPPDALIVGEPSGWSTVVLGYKGKLDLRYRVTRPPTHPSNPEPKASELAARCWQALLDLLGPDSGHGAFDRPGATLIALHGDPVAAEAEFDVRIPPGFDTDALLRALRERTPHGELTELNTVPAVRTTRRDPVVRALSAAVRAHGGELSQKVKTATSDMNTLARAWDVPMATYGPGDSRLDHADDEHIEIDEYLSGISVLTHALRRLATDEELTRSHP